MSHAFHTQKSSPRFAILSKSESSCQEQSAPGLRLTPPHAPDRVATHAPIAERRLRITDHARAKRAAHLCVLASELPPDERALVLARFADGRSAAQIGAIAGCPRHIIERRLRRLTIRLSTPAFVYLAPRLNLLDAVQRSIAQACFIEGRSIRAAAAHLNISQHALRETRAVLLAQVHAARPRPMRDPRPG